MTSTLFHVTPRFQVESILKYGIATCLATGRKEVVWLCDAARLPWAVAHVAAHKGQRIEDMSILHVNVNGMELKKVRTGVYTSKLDVPVKSIGDVVYYALGEPE